MKGEIYCTCVYMICSDSVCLLVCPYLITLNFF